MMANTRLIFTVTGAALLLVVVLGFIHSEFAGPAHGFKSASETALKRIRPLIQAPKEGSIEKRGAAGPCQAGQAVAQRLAWEDGTAPVEDWAPRFSSSLLLEEDKGDDDEFAIGTASNGIATYRMESRVPEVGDAADPDGQQAPTKDLALDIPVALQLRSISATSIRVSWESTEGADGYDLYLCEDKIVYWSDCHSVEVETNQAELTGLKPDSRYRLDIVAYSRDGSESESSEALFLETLGPDSDRVDIPPMGAAAALEINGSCYNDCDNHFAFERSQGIDFNLETCRQRCDL
jgi:hypothetical protein